MIIYLDKGAYIGEVRGDARTWLYGLSRDELRYVLDPQEVYGADFPGETFRVLTKSPSFGRR